MQQAGDPPKKGFLVCNSNCAVIGIVIPLAAIQAQCGTIDTVSVVTSQALSGAGYPGVSAMDSLDNVVPYISGEEEKMEPEARKILGGVDVKGSRFVERKDLRVSATCTRVNVTDGHMAFVSIRFANRENIPSAETVKQAMRDYVSEAQKMGCPSAPERAITVLEQPDRPQPRLDRDADRGYSVSVGRVREDPSGIWDVMFVALSHNSRWPCNGLSFREKAGLTWRISNHWCWRLLDIKCRGRCIEGVRVDGGSCVILKLHQQALSIYPRHTHHDAQKSATCYVAIDMNVKHSLPLRISSIAVSRNISAPTSNFQAPIYHHASDVYVDFPPFNAHSNRLTRSKTPKRKFYTQQTALAEQSTRVNKLSLTI